MSFDLAAHMRAMSRVVRNLERDGKPAKAVVASRVYDTDAADLWDALTNRERLPRWFAPVAGDLKLGGRFEVENNASGTITECVPEKRIAATWEFGGGVSWIEINLSPDGGGTRLELQHIAHIDPHWDMFGPGAVGVGWDLSFLGLAANIEDPSSSKPPETDDTFHTTQDGKTVIGGAAQAWGEAAIAAGEDRAKALEAAENTRKFYMGEMPPPQM